MNNRKESTINILIAAIVFIVVAAAVFCIYTGHTSDIIIAAAIISIAIVAVGFMRYSEEDDYLRARQSDRSLRLVCDTLPYMRNGLTSDSMQSVCELILPKFSADAVSITDDTKLLGFSGLEEEFHRPGQPIRSDRTSEVLQTGTLRVQVDYPIPNEDNHKCALRSVIIVPLKVRDVTHGTLKLYYRSSKRITETQIAMAEGLGEILSTQLSLSELDAASERAAEFELRALQAQINPHFLFNTINTITSLVRTDPMKARDLLREFAAFYRGTLENSADFIPLRQEIAQTARYMNLEIARFGEDRIQVEYKIDEQVEEVPLPSFIIQPLVENSIVHGLSSEDPLHIKIEAVVEGNDVVIIVEDDGEGIPEEKLPFLLEIKEGSTSGIALNNVDSRLKALFGEGSGISVTSTVGEGTYVRLYMAGALDTEERTVC